MKKTCHERGKKEKNSYKYKVHLERKFLVSDGTGC